MIFFFFLINLNTFTQATTITCIKMCKVISLKLKQVKYTSIYFYISVYSDNNMIVILQ